MSGWVMIRSLAAAVGAAGVCLVWSRNCCRGAEADGDLADQWDSAGDPDRKRGHLPGGRLHRACGRRAPRPARDSVARGHAAAIDARTGRLLGWNPRVNGRVNAIALWRRRVYLGGVFSSVRGAHRRNIAAVGRRRGHVKAWNPGADAGVHVIRLGANGGVYLGGEVRPRRTAPDVEGWPRSPQQALSPHGRPASDRSSGSACPPRCHPKVLTLAFAAGGKALYIGGHFGKVDGVARNEAAEISLANPQQRPGVQPQHLRQRQLPRLHHDRDASRLHDHPHRQPRLHLRRILAGKREPPILQRQRLRPPQRTASVRASPQQDDGDTPGVHAPPRHPLRRRPLQRGRPRLPTKPHRQPAPPDTTSPPSTPPTTLCSAGTPTPTRPTASSS